MTRNELNVALAAIITTVAETETAPEGVMFAALMDRMDAATFGDCIALLKKAGMLLSIGPHEVRISAEGKLLAAKINAHAAERMAS